MKDPIPPKDNLTSGRDFRKRLTSFQARYPHLAIATNHLQEIAALFYEYGYTDGLAEITSSIKTVTEV